MILYLTATGNSLYVAKALAPAAGGVLASIPQEMRRQPAERVYRDEVVGIVCPIFGHELPTLVREFVRTSTFEAEYLFVVGTYGCNHGDFSERAQAVFAEVGRPADYVNTIIMVDNGLPAFDIEEELRIDPKKRVDEHIAQLAADVRLRRAYVQPTTDEDRQHHLEYMQFDDRIELLAEGELLRVSADCNACGICARVCPTGNIRVSGIAEHGFTRCIGCLACIHACPAKATKFVELTEKNPNVHYRNPHISLAEIIAANDQSVG